MDKGIIIGVEVEAATRTSLSFAMFRHVTSVSTCTSSPFLCVMLRPLTVTPVPASYFAHAPRELAREGSCCFRIALPAPRLLRSCA